MDKNNEKSGRVEKASHIIELWQRRHEDAEHLNDVVSYSCFLLTRVFGRAAYRRFDFLRGKPVANIAGSKRGIVRNLRWRVAFDRLDGIGRGSELLGEALDVTGLVLDFTHSLLNSWHRVREETESEDTWDTKSAKIATQIASISLRAASLKYRSSAINAVHRAEWGVHTARWVGGMVGYDVTHPSRAVQFVDFASARVESWADSLTDGDKLYRVVNTYINFPIEQRINLNDHEFPRYGSPRDRYMRYMVQRGRV